MNIRNHPDGWDREPEFRAFIYTEPAHAYVHRYKTTDSNDIEKPPGSEHLILLLDQYANYDQGSHNVLHQYKSTPGHFVNYVDIQTGDTVGPFPLFL